MTAATRQSYRRALFRWVGGMGVFVFALAAFVAWYAVVSADVGPLSRVLWYGPLLILAAFLAISMYYLVLGVLPDEPASDAPDDRPPRRPLNP